ncbi:SusC/RagA family TonB-linked outer membrane protein [Pedobacter boryungensis]|uniref:SusC/RagA family TonB-linked outer membrane protein n=1 Tax=Pedobacter boryungensis TaxID=869962 RepID=A0ABX2DG52_9SPHI|nr:SusC/RagA family TonB-linked outer membrane protein [Pedobacter boryungensis]NQX33073.1 SusC/RagA family TonB-linked outer membrane protein [Pedobacter boryungensis]
MKQKLLLLMVMSCWLFNVALAQQITIKGKITDSEGAPIPGANVKVQNTQKFAVSDSEGGYVINVPNGSTALEFSFIGYVSQTKTIGTSRTIDVVLVGDSKSLDVVVVTAVGIEKNKASLGYSAVIIKNEDLTNGKQTNLINGLTGKTPGVQIGRSSGGVNTATRITMRGTRSLQGEGQPLFVIDGMPIDNSASQPSSTSANQVDVGNRIGDINPDDIESVTILKGANAAALYGSQGVNGAIVITTKTGKDAAMRNKKLEINVVSTFQMDKVQKLPELQNEFGSGYENGTGNPAIYDEIENTNWGPKFDGKMVQSGPTLANGHTLMIPYSAVSDNAKNFFNTGTNIQNSISFQGGNEKGSFYASLSDNQVKGVVPEDKFRRNTFKFSGSTKLANNFNVNANVSYNKNLTNTSFVGTGNNSVISDVLNVSRQINLANFKDWKNYEFATTQGFFNGYQPNPYYAIANNRFSDNLDRFLGSLQMGYAPTNWLNVTWRLGTDYTSTRRKQTFEKTVFGTGQRPTATPGAIIEDAFSNRIMNSDLLLTFKKDLSKDFNATLILLNNIRQTDTRNLTASASAISTPGFFNLSNRVGELGGSETINKKRLIGWAGDLTVGYKEYLFLNGTLRNDISSTLPKDNNSYFYPSTSISFIPTEAFSALKNNKILSYAKLRASFAKVGSDANAYSLVPTFGAAAGFPFGSLAAFTLSNTTPNPTLKPEFTTSYEIGTELSFLKDKVGIDFTYYSTSTDGQIINIGIPAASGFTAATVNAGVVTNKGIEVALKGNPFRNRDGFSWNFTVSYTHNVNVVKSLYQDSKQLSLGTGDPVPTAIVGQPISLLGTAYLRDPQGRIVVDAVSGYIKLDPKLKNLGQVNPKHILGFNNTFSYKSFSLSTTFDYRTGNVIYSGTKNTLTFTGSSLETTKYGREAFVYPNSVIETSPGVFTPNTTVKTRSGNFDFWYGNFNSFAESSIVDAAFLKLRDASFSYQLPAKLLNKTPFGKVSLAVSAANILLWTPKSNVYIDPEANIFGTNNSQGREFTSIPSTKTFGLTLNATF